MKKLTRQQISEAIAAEAPEVPFTMPFFLAGELIKECRRQGLPKIVVEGPDAPTNCVSPSAPFARCKLLCGADWWPNTFGAERKEFEPIKSKMITQN